MQVLFYDTFEVDGVRSPENSDVFLNMLWANYGPSNFTAHLSQRQATASHILLIMSQLCVLVHFRYCLAIMPGSPLNGIARRVIYRRDPHPPVEM